APHEPLELRVRPAAVVYEAREITQSPLPDLVLPAAPLRDHDVEVAHARRDQADVLADGRPARERSQRLHAVPLPAEGVEDLDWGTGLEPREEGGEAVAAVQLDVIVLAHAAGGADVGGARR